MKKSFSPFIWSLFVLFFAGCSSSSSSSNNRYAIPSATERVREKAVPFIDNLQASSVDTRLLQNPDRGFRGETYITLGSGVAYPSGSNDAFEELNKEIAMYKDEGANIIQAYVYLSEFYNKEISQEAFDQLTQFFQIATDNNTRFLLRFAYDYSTSNKTGARTDQILSHLDQIDQWIQNNSDLFHKTVYATQLGIIGLWGEGHGESRRIDKAKVLPKFFEVIPEDIFIQVRLPDFLEYIPHDQFYRVSFHDDFLVGVDHDWGMIPRDHEQFGDLLAMNTQAVSDGEMPWGRDKTISPMDPLLIFDQIVYYSLTSLSIKHNYREEDGGIHPYVLERAKSIPLSESYLQENSVPYNPMMLQDGNIDLFTYLQYHLGYNLVAGNFEENDGTGSFRVYNFGLAAPHEFVPELRVNGEVIPQQYESGELMSQSSTQFTFPYTEGDKVTLSFTHRRVPELSIRLANSLPYDNGVISIKGE